MIIPKSAIRKFLERKLDNCNKYKLLTNDQLDDRMQRLPIQPPIWFKLKRHQQASFLLGVDKRRIYIGSDTGTGKSLLSIALIRYFKKLKLTKCALVLTPTKISKYEWAREIDKHSPKTKYCVLVGSSKHKWEQLTEDKYDLVIASYMGLVRMLCDLVPPKGRKKKDHLKPDKKKIDSILAIFNGLILDESTHCKTYGTLPFRICRQLSKTAKFVFALSGTPFGSDPTDLWAQMFLVDRGETLGPTLGLFRAAFFNAKKSYWGGFDYTFKKTMNNKLHVMLANRMIRYEANQSDLPKLVEIVKEVRLPEGAWIYRDRAKETIEAAHGSYRDMQNAFMRLRQISSGWLGYYDDDTNSKAQFQFTPNPKLELLISIIGSIDPKYKIIVFYEFNFSASLIEHELNKLKLGFVRIWSGTKDHAEVLHRFDNEVDCQILLLQNSAGFGPNLQVARYGIYFESPVSPIVRTQTRRRFERQHSAHDVVFQYYLTTLGTYDKKILFSLKAGHDLFRSIIDGKACQVLGKAKEALSEMGASPRGGK